MDLFILKNKDCSSLHGSITALGQLNYIVLVYLLNWQQVATGINRLNFDAPNNCAKTSYYKYYYRSHQVLKQRTRNQNHRITKDRNTEHQRNFQLTEKSENAFQGSGLVFQ